MQGLASRACQRPFRSLLAAMEVRSISWPACHSLPQPALQTHNPTAALKPPVHAQPPCAGCTPHALIADRRAGLGDTASDRRAADAAAAPPPPLQGTLFRYGPGAAHVAFLSGSGPARHPRHAVLVGGLTDGLLAVPYAAPLAARLHAAGVSLVQTLLSSSHTGYGLASLDQDAEELHLLAAHLKDAHGSQVGPAWGGARQRWRPAPGARCLLRRRPLAGPSSCCAPVQGFTIIGHSTGCQDAVRYAQRYRSSAAAPPLQAVVLQAPVSDAGEAVQRWVVSSTQSSAGAHC